MKSSTKKYLLWIYVIVIVFSSPLYALAQRANMTYLYAGTTSIYINNVDRAKGAINIVCPDYFEIYDPGNGKGELKLLPKIDTAFVDAMHERNVKVTPFLTNHWDRAIGRAGLQNRTQLAAQLVSAVNQYGFDGVNIDIENLNENDRAAYTDFIQILKDTLPPGKTITIAVAANPYGVYYGWAGSYDYKVLGQLCDYIMIMAYDESYYGSPEGPVASSSFVENSLKYTLTQIPADKILLGVPFYGRYWKQGALKGGSGITSYDVESLISKYNGKVTYDYSTQTAKAVVTIGENDPKPVIWGGVVLSAGTYTIYYDNEQSLKYKLNLIQKYGIKGAGSWCLGQESLKTWDYFGLWLNGKYFTDILGHFAEDDILAVAAKGWMIGGTNNAFAPNRTITRAEAAIVMVKALGLQNQSPAEPFSDTISHYARDLIGIARKYQIILGDGSNRFWPNSPLTREQMAMILDRILVLPAPVNGNPFSDVTPLTNPLSYDSIMRLAANDITKGNGIGSFYPLGYVHRGEMAAFMNRASIYEFTYPAKQDPTLETPKNIVEPR